MRSVTHRWHPTSPDAIGMRWFPFLSSALLLVVALLPRIWDLGRFITFDEANFWLKRSEIFFQALASGNLGATAITVHPGVTTMWLGGAGIQLHRRLLAAGLLPHDTFALRLALAQLPVALVHTAGVLLGYWLLRRLVRPSVAFLAALLWAADPFVIGYSRILHVDALAGTFLTLSLLAACAYWHHQGSAKLLALSAVCASLAMLSKSPAAALLPIVALIALASTSGARPNGARRWAITGQRLRQAAGPLLAWSGIALITSIVLWPALVVAPAGVLDLLRLGVSAEGAQPHQLGNFFLGQAYADTDPGLRYYPVALVLRATPWTLLGLLLLPLALGQLKPRTRRDVLALAGFVIVFTLTLDLFPKKFDRYLVPAFPAIDILAAVGLMGILNLGIRLLDVRLPDIIAMRQQRTRQAPEVQLHPEGVQLATSHGGPTKNLVPETSLATSLRLVGVASIGALALLNVTWWHPYEIGAYNQLLGGARKGAETFVVGWGEGLEQAAGWLNQQPDITGVTVAALRTEPLQAYLRAGAQAVAPPENGFAAHTGYAVVYLPDVQGGPAWPPFDRVVAQLQPAHEVMIHGMPYAWIYQLPPPVTHRLPTSFGQGLRLLGYTLEAPPQPGKDLTFALSWATNAHPPTNVALFVHLLGSDGARHAQVDPVLPVETWGPNRFFTTAISLALPADLAGGHYEVVIGVYDRTTGQRMPLQSVGTGANTPDGPNALKLAEFDLSPP